MDFHILYIVHSKLIASLWEISFGSEYNLVI